MFLGIFGAQNTNVIGWTALTYFYCLSIYGMKAPNKIAWLIGIAVMLPVIIGGVNAQYPLPAVDNSAFLFLFLSFLLPVASLGFSFTSFTGGYLLYLRYIAAHATKFESSIHFTPPLFFSISQRLWIADVLITFRIGAIHKCGAVAIQRWPRQAPFLVRCYWRLTLNCSLMQA